MAEVRRVVRSGGGCSINLPSPYLRDLGIQRGDYVVVEMIGEGIRITKLHRLGVGLWASDSKQGADSK